MKSDRERYLAWAGIIIAVLSGGGPNVYRAVTDNPSPQVLQTEIGHLQKSVDELRVDIKNLEQRTRELEAK